MHDVMKCKVCGRTLPKMSKSATCGAKCRKRKSRFGLDAGKNAMAARNALRYLIHGLELDVIDTTAMFEEYDEIRAVFERLREAYNSRWEREHATGE